MPEIDIKDYEKRCKDILEDEEVRFAGLLDESGELLVGGFKQNINHRLTEEQQKAVCKEVAGRVAKRKKYDT